MNSETTQEIPDWKLERYALGELPEEELADIRRALEADDALRQRLEALERSDQEIRDRYSSGWMSHQIRRKLGVQVEAGSESKRSVLSGLRPLVPVAAAIVVALVALPSFWPDDEAPEEIRIKGDAALVLSRKTETGSERLDEGALARKGDLVLVQYQAAGREFGVILSIDGVGVITRHLPIEGRRAIKLQQGGAVSVGFAYELDDAPHWEKFYFITSDSPFEVDLVMQAARAAVKDTTAIDVSLDLPDDFKQSVFVLKKDPNDE
jgi:hypothetical protein